MKKNNTLPFIIIFMSLSISFIVFSCKKDNSAITIALSTNEIDSITSTSARCGGEITNDGGDFITQYGICYSQKKNPVVTDSFTIDGEGVGKFVSRITGLSAGVKYYIRAYAVNSKGVNYGSIRSFITSSVIDIDNNVYKIINIGDQVWMAENLRTTRYSDGSAIPYVNSTSSWDTLSRFGLGYCYYNDDSNNAKTYGALYTWAAAMKGSTVDYPLPIQGVCPTGWHLPSSDEWNTLTSALGGVNVAGDKLKEAGNIHWTSLNTKATNSSGFTALPGGSRKTDGSFQNIGTAGYWWSCNRYYDTQATLRYMTNASSVVTQYQYDRSMGLSVRCVKD